MKDMEIKIRVSEVEKAVILRESESLGVSMSEYIRSRLVPTNVPTSKTPGKTDTEIVPTSPKKVVVEGEGVVHTEEVPVKDVATNVHTDKWARELVLGAREVGERENWQRVYRELEGKGYKYDIVTKELSKNGVLVERI